MSASQNLKDDWKNVATRTITAGGVEFAYRELGTNNPSTPVYQRVTSQSLHNRVGAVIPSL